MKNDSNILKTEMLDNEMLNMYDLKMNDVVKLKNNKYAKIVSNGEICNDIDYGEMYKNIKRFEYISKENFESILSEKEKEKQEKLKLENEKGKYLDDVRQYIQANRKLVSEEEQGVLHDEYRCSEDICKIEPLGIFYKINNKIRQRVSAGYNVSYYELVNITEDQLKEIKVNIEEI